MMPGPSVPTHNAMHDGFNYYGRWQRGPVAISINSGALVEFAYTGHRCELLFDVAGLTHEVGTRISCRTTNL